MTRAINTVSSEHVKPWQTAVLALGCQQWHYVYPVILGNIIVWIVVNW